MPSQVVLTEDGSYNINFSTESDLRDGLADIARRCGWDVDTEFVVHGWGRPDILLRQPGTVIAIELKTDIVTPSKCRKAIQQADTYVKALPNADRVILAAANVSWDEMSKYEAAYPDVWVMDASTLLWFMKSWSGESDRHRVALSRYRRLEREVELSRRVLADLSGTVDSPLSPRVDIDPNRTIKRLTSRTIASGPLDGDAA